MKANRYLILFLMISMFLTSCYKSPNDIDKSKPDYEENPISTPDEERVDMIKEKIKEMTLDEKIGQLLIVGLEDSTVDENTKTMIKDYKIGGFILFSRNIKDENSTLKLINDLKIQNSSNKIPLFISIDEEGGRVSRLPKVYKKLPEAKKIGDIDNEDIAYEFGQLLGERLNTLGINLNYGPVLDINSNPNNPVIGTRAFGDNAETVIRTGIKVIKGIESTGVIPVPKHFPGHGDTGIDSHVNLPIVDKTLDELEDLELLPFIKAIEEGTDMIMVAHILFPQLDDKFPSTMSYEILTNLLRERLGFNGVIISDDMTMGAIVENYSIEKGAIEFLKGGGDIALICHGSENPIKVINEIKDRIHNGEITIEDIERKVYRILSLKEKYKIQDKIIEEIQLIDLNRFTDDFLKKINK